MTKVKINKKGIISITSPFRWIFVTALIFIISANTIDILRVWIYIGAYIIGALISCYIFITKIPHLANDRGEVKKGTKKWDTPIVFSYFLLAIIVTPLVAGMDYRWGTSLLPFNYLYLGLGLYIISFIFSIWPLLYNPFFEGTVRIQTDKNHKVIDKGPYKIVRHPGYIGMILGALALPFAFGSLLSLIPATLMVILVIIRTYLEDKTLQYELAGYLDYTKRVKYRLIPYIF